MKTRILLLIFSLFLMNTYAQGDLPKLENPMSVEYLKKNIRNGSPRLVYTQKSVKQIRKQLQKDPVLSNMYAAIRLNAEGIYEEPLLERKITGRRLLSVSRKLLYRINMLGFIYLMEEDERSLERINQEVLAVCAFEDWNQSHFLDVAEMALGVSLALDWTQEKLPQSTIALAKEALKEKALLKSWPENSGKWYLATNTSNWNQVCAGGLIAASLVLAEDEPELASKTISRALDGLPYALAAYGPDGVYPEGSTYWSYATRFSVATIAMFESAFGTDFGHSDFPGFRESALFRTLCNAPSGMYYNYFDCGNSRGKNGDETLAWFAAKSGISTYFEKERFLQDIAEMKELSRISGIAMAWIAEYRGKSEIEVPTAWKGDGVNPIAIFKSKAEDPHQFYLGCKGGKASLSHGNMDAGSFVFELNGVRWSIDPGIQPYHALEKTGFDLWGKGQDAERWTLLTKNNFAHSTITINDEPFIHDAFAPILDFEDGKNPAVSFDLSAVFGENVRMAHRRFTKEGPAALLIEDEIQISEQTETVTWQLMTVADVEIVDGGAVLTQDGQSLKLEILSHPELSISILSLYPPPLELDLRMEGLKRIDIRIPAWMIDDEGTTLRVRLSEY